MSKRNSKSTASPALEEPAPVKRPREEPEQQNRDELQGRAKDYQYFKQNMVEVAVNSTTHVVEIRKLIFVNENEGAVFNYHYHSMLNMYYCHALSCSLSDEIFLAFIVAGDTFHSQGFLKNKTTEVSGNVDKQCFSYLY